MALCDNSNIDHSMYKEAQTCYTLLELIIKKKRANVKTGQSTDCSEGQIAKELQAFNIHTTHMRTQIHTYTKRISDGNTGIRKIGFAHIEWEYIVDSLP